MELKDLNRQDKQIEYNIFECNVPAGITPRKVIDSIIPNQFDPTPMRGLDVHAHDQVVFGFPETDMDTPFNTADFDIAYFETPACKHVEMERRIKEKFGDKAALPDISTALFIFAKGGAMVAKAHPAIGSSYSNNDRLPTIRDFQDGKYALGVDYIHKRPRLAFGYAGEMETYNKAIVILPKNSPK